jgi:hypothetical protein
LSLRLHQLLLRLRLRLRQHLLRLLLRLHQCRDLLRRQAIASK